MKKILTTLMILTFIISCSSNDLHIYLMQLVHSRDYEASKKLFVDFKEHELKYAVSMMKLLVENKIVYTAEQMRELKEQIQKVANRRENLTNYGCTYFD